jgi:hypothetical protein
MLQRGEIELDVGEGLGRGRKVTSVPRLPLASPTTFSGATGIAMGEAM